MAQARSGGVAGLRWLHGLVCGAVVALATPLALFTLVLLAPALLVLLQDRRPGRPAARAILLLGLACAVAPLLDFWRQGMTMDAALASADMSIAVAWVVQAAGWLAMELVPLFIALALDAAAAVRISRLRAARERILGEWDMPGGTDVRTRQD